MIRTVPLVLAVGPGPSALAPGPSALTLLGLGMMIVALLLRDDHAAIAQGTIGCAVLTSRGLATV